MAGGPSIAPKRKSLPGLGNARMLPVALLMVPEKKRGCRRQWRGTSCCAHKSGETTKPKQVLLIAVNPVKLMIKTASVTHYAMSNYTIVERMSVTGEFHM